PITFFAYILVIKLRWLRAEHESLLVVNKRMCEMRVVGQKLVQRFFFFLRRRVERGKLVARFFRDTDGLLVDLLFRDGEVFLEVAMDRGLEHLVAVEGAQLIKVYEDERRRGQKDRQAQGQDEPESIKAAQQFPFIHVRALQNR